jgi:predicted RNase H-like HicB family nuclease
MKKQTGTKAVKIVIERSEGSFSAFAESIPGIYGQGDTVDAVKKSIDQAIDLFKKYNPQQAWPKILQADFELVYKFDTESFFNYYKKIFTNAALERMTGINQKQLQHYGSGLKKPRSVQKKKIESAMHALGKELLAVEL